MIFALLFPSELYDNSNCLADLMTSGVPQHCLVMLVSMERNHNRCHASSGIPHLLRKPERLSSPRLRDCSEWTIELKEQDKYQGTYTNTYISKTNLKTI